MKKRNSEIGVFWGDSFFAAVRVDKGSITQSLQVPFSEIIEEGIEPDAPEDLRKTALLRKRLVPLANGIDQVSLAIPAQNIIFRSFVVPMMSADDVRNVIDFEVTKYIPIELKDLTSTYHYEPVVVDGQKMLQVLFVAVKKTFLQQVTQIFRNAGFTIDRLEPAPINLLRCVKAQRLLGKTDGTAILTVSPGASDIVVFHNESLHFVRSLNLGHVDSNRDVFKAAILDDITVSFNFFNRQNPNKKIVKFIIVTDEKAHDLEKELSQELGVPTVMIDAGSVYSGLKPVAVSSAIAAAFGMTKRAFSTRNFDLSSQALQMAQSGESPQDLQRRTLIAAGVLSLCLAVPVALHFLTGCLIKENLKRVETVNAQVGAFAALNAADIRAKKDARVAEALKYVEAQVKSEIARVLYRIGLSLPEGAWLTGISAEYKPVGVALKESGLLREGDGTAVIADVPIFPLTAVMEGQVYLADAHDQLRRITGFVSGLTSDQVLRGIFSSVQRKETTEKVINEATVSEFKITCE